MCSPRERVAAPAGKTLVSKVQKNTASLQEITLVAKIRELPLASHYFLLPEPEVCHLNTSEKLMVKQSCDVVENTPFERLTQMTIPYGGQSLRTATIDFQTFSFKRFMKHLLEGIKLLKTNSYVHADLHLGNVLLSSTGLPLIIDFAKLISLKETSEAEIKKRFLAFESGHDHIPPECLLIAGLHVTPKTSEQIIDVIPNMNGVYSLAANYTNYTREDMQADLRSFLKRFMAENPKTYLDLPTFWHTISSKFDTYSCGYIFVNLLANFLRSPYFSRSQGTSSIIQKVIRGLLCANPYERLSPEEAIQLLS